MKEIPYTERSLGLSVETLDGLHREMSHFAVILQLPRKAGKGIGRSWEREKTQLLTNIIELIECRRAALDLLRITRGKMAKAEQAARQG
jgi:hypothetical protein